MKKKDYFVPLVHALVLIDWLVGWLFYSALLSAHITYNEIGSDYGDAPDPSTSGHYLVIRTPSGD